MPGCAGSRDGAVETKAVSWICILVGGGANRKIDVSDSKCWVMRCSGAWAVLFSDVQRKL